MMPAIIVCDPCLYAKLSWRCAGPQLFFRNASRLTTCASLAEGGVSSPSVVVFLRSRDRGLLLHRHRSRSGVRLAGVGFARVLGKRFFVEIFDGARHLGQCLAGIGDDLELDGERHRGILEDLYRRERHQQALGNAVERQPDLEGVLVGGEVPVLVLEDDGHVLGVAGEEAARHPHPRRVGGEGDEEMMLAGQAGARHLGHDLADDAAKRVLGEDVVAYLVVGHGPGMPKRGARAPEKKMEASVARCLRTPPYDANRKDFE